MSFAGKWTLNVSSPMGAHSVTVEMEEDDAGALTGKAQGPTGELEMTGQRDGDNISFSGTADSPMGALELKFTGTQSGEEASGDASFGSFGSGTWTATRS